LPIDLLFWVWGAVAGLGLFFLTLAFTSRFICNLPDSLPKAVFEMSLHGVAVLGPLILGGLFLVWGSAAWTPPPFSTHPAELFLWRFLVIAATGTFGVFTLLDLKKWIAGPAPLPGVEVISVPRPYLEESAPLSFVNQLYDLEVRRLRLSPQRTGGKCSGLRIGHLTDFHLGDFLSDPFLRHSIRRLLELEPHLLAVTGDFVNFTRHLDPCFEALKELKAPLGIFAVRGNHDYWVDPEGIAKRIGALGWTLLHDRTVSVPWAGSEILVSGIESPWSQAWESLEFLPDRTEQFHLVLSHTPDEFPRLRGKSPHLVLSGHTHGGQICFPFYGPVLVPSKFGRKYARGPFLENDSLLYVSRGIGCYPPLRTLCRPEVTLIEIL
jgi:predicted MPP superfamily phosphohydrolase